MFDLGQDNDQRTGNILWSNLCSTQNRSHTKASKTVDNLNQNKPKWKAQRSMTFFPALISTNYYNKVSVKWMTFFRLSIWNCKNFFFSFNLLLKLKVFSSLWKCDTPLLSPAKFHCDLSFESSLRFSGLLLLRCSVNIWYFVPFLFKLKISTRRYFGKRRLYLEKEKFGCQ